MKKQTKWEYLITYDNLEALGKDSLNVYGEEGWELCTSISTLVQDSDMSSTWPSVTKLIFKRPL